MAEGRDRGGAGGPKGGGVSDTEEGRLFLRALESLGEVPDKDRPSRPARGDRSVRRLKPSKSRGLVPQDRLDLHRETVEKGLRRLREFVVGCSLRRLRHVVVVTGKGLHSRQGTGVLKQAVEQWILRSGRAWVRAYSEAPRREGGAGAWMLYLRGGGDDA